MWSEMQNTTNNLFRNLKNQFPAAFAEGSGK